MESQQLSKGDMKSMQETINPIGLDGIEFVEFASADPAKLEQLWYDFGFSKIMKHKSKDMTYFRQNDIHFLVNNEPGTRGTRFSQIHGPCISAMGWRAKDAKKAFELAVQRGAKPCPSGDYLDQAGRPIPAIFGIGDSVIYFIDHYTQPDRYEQMGFVPLSQPVMVKGKGFVAIDHLTNNVEKGTMQNWADFYKNVFGFTEVRYFDIRGVKTGLTSYALRSPCQKFCIPINEGTEDKSQINEYLREYKGPGIQHLAFLTENILASLQGLEDTKIETLDIDDEYYQTVFNRVPNVTENHKELQKYDILIDGDDQGYLLQIFTKNLIGPIFIEIIQRKNNLTFGEGNFGALFRSIEKDQQRRGVI